MKVWIARDTDLIINKEQWQLLGELKKAGTFLFETFPKINKINTPMGYILRNK